MNLHAGTPVLAIEGLEAGYNGVPVVRDLTLRVREGEIVGLLGANGAGKTTTLLTISGLLSCLDGAMRLDGRDIVGLEPQRVARLGIAHVPEDRGLFYSLSVADNLVLASATRRVNIEPAMTHFPALRPLLDRRAGLLSGGEQQMLAIARALLAKPRLLMIDEMSLGLAPVIVESLFPTVQNVARETGCGVLLVEQHVDLALEVADRAYVMSRGQVALEGNAREIANSRADVTRGYLGS